MTPRIHSPAARWRWSHHLPERGPLRKWIAAPGSLTSHLRRASTTFEVRRLSQRTAASNPDERIALGRPRGRGTLVRDVLLCGDGQPLVFGHSVTTLRQLRGPWRALRKLGSRPLADALYRDPRIRREALEFRKLHRGQPLFRRIESVLGAMPATLWARRSRFTRDGAPLLVTEVFLPAITYLGAG